MDPVTAIGLTGTVIQLISLGVKCTKVCWKWHKKDATTGISDLLELNQAFQKALAADALASSSHFTQDGLGQLAQDCKTFSEMLQGRLSGLTSKKYIFTAHELDELKDKLAVFRDKLTICLLFSLRRFAMQSPAKQNETAQALKLHPSGKSSLESNVRAILKHVTADAVDSSSKRWQEDLRHDMIQMIYSGRSAIPHPGGDAGGIVLSPEMCDKLQKDIISTLRYDGMEDRTNNITETYEKTFQWILQREQSDTQKWDNLPHWLEGPSQIYWVTGKAGSGKSTLMKFLCDDNPSAQGMATGSMSNSRCKSFLAEWTGDDKELVMASFYFWASEPDSHQASYGALLRTLLYQVFRRKPQIIPSIAPSRWEALSILGYHRQMQMWSDTELKASLILAVRNLTQAGYYVMLFIDGLDEFTGRPKDLISLIHELLEINTHVKVCVASRPWVDFEDAFQLHPNLRLEDLTHDDIKYYVTRHFGGNAAFSNLGRRNPTFANQLVDNVVSKASGVFLWIKLVVASLLAGISYGDRIEDLQRRLDFLPSDLEKLYDRMLNDLDPFYHEHAAQMITLIESAREPLPLTVFSFADEDNLSSLRELPNSALEATNCALRLDDTRRRLNSRWKGLLEVVQMSYTTSSQRGVYSVVEYLHKTVKEFVQTEKLRLFLHASLQNSEFDAHFQLCMAYCAELKTSKKTFDEHNIRNCLYHANQVSAKNEADMVLVVDHLARIPRLRSMDLLHRAVKESSILYLKAKLSVYQDSKVLNKLLTVAVREPSVLNAEVIGYLLELGADPNLMWMELLCQIPSATSLPALNEHSRSTVIAFVSYGASVEEGRIFHVRSFKNRFGSREISGADKFSDAFFNDLKAIEIIRKRPLADRMGSWIRRKNLV